MLSRRERSGMGQDPAAVAPPRELHVPGPVELRLATVGWDPDVLSALLDLEGLERQAWRLSESMPGSAAPQAWAWPARSNWPRQNPTGNLAGRVREVLRGVWRASSLVECINSVAKCIKGRYRKMTQGLLDLKRLYWKLASSGPGTEIIRRRTASWAGSCPR